MIGIMRNGYGIIRPTMKRNGVIMIRNGVIMIGMMRRNGEEESRNVGIGIIGGRIDVIMIL